MTPEIIEIDGQLYGGILHEGSGGISCSCHKVTAVRQFRCVAVEVIEPPKVIPKESPISNWFWFAAFICAGVVLATTYFFQ